MNVQLSVKILPGILPHGDLSAVSARGRAGARKGTWPHKTWRRVWVACLVILGHVAFVWVITNTYDHRLTQRLGGQAIGLNLVGAAPEAVATSPAVCALVKPQTAIVLDAATPPPAPIADRLAAESALTDLRETLPVTLVVTGPPSLTDADTQALNTFQPASAQLGGSEVCNLTPSVVHDFLHSDVVRQGVAELPASEKSVANAIQVWDGGWPAETLSGGKALLRAVLTREIAAAPADCLHQVNSGPVFFMVPDGAATVMVAVGSGQWTWGQLLD